MTRARALIPKPELKRRCSAIAATGFIPVILPDGTVTGTEPGASPLPGKAEARDAGAVFNERLAARPWARSR